MTTHIQQFTKGKCFCIFCHASLEWEIADILKTLGIKVVKANNDRQHSERPCIPDYTDMDFGDPLRERIRTATCTPEDFADVNFIFMMNTDKFQHVVPHLATFKPVILYLFGQHTDTQLAEFAGCMNVQWEKGLQPNIFTVCYARREFEYLESRLASEVKNHLRYIRFSKRLEHYYPWKVPALSGTINQWLAYAPNRLPFVFTACNSIHNRGDGCGWAELSMIRHRLPHILCGHETEQVGGTGRIPFEDLKRFYWTCGAYLSFPAWPAPLVMNCFESMMAGCPIAFLDNGRGAADEGLFDNGVGCLSTSPNDLYEYCKRAITDKGFQKEQSERCQQRAIEFYEFSRNIKHWVSLFEEVEKFW